jgi:integrase
MHFPQHDEKWAPCQRPNRYPISKRLRPKKLKLLSAYPVRRPAGRARDHGGVHKIKGSQNVPKKREKEKIICPYFTWLLGDRNGVYTVDGRSNPIDAGRHSLGTRERSKALNNLKELDRLRAVELGLADRMILNASGPEALNLEKGRDLYMRFVGRSAITGGAGKTTVKRYRAVFGKFLAFALKKHVTEWNQVTKNVLSDYAAWLDEESYAYATEYLELTTLKQAIKWLIQESHLPQSALIRLPVKKPSGTDTYCYRPAEVAAIVDYCRQRAELVWLGNILTGLATTGVRISELAALRWSDMSDNLHMIQIVDERHRRRRGGEVRTTKTGRSRAFPIHGDLRQVLETLPRAPDGRIFHGPRGGRLKADVVRRVLIHDVLEKLEGRFPTRAGEIGFINGRLHSFRHYFCSTCAQSGVPENIVMSWLGHSSSKMVRHYFHLHDDESQRQMKRLKFVGDAGGAVAAGNGS